MAEIRAQGVQKEMPMSYRPPETYEDLIKLIHDRYDDMSKSYQKIALYLTQNPNDVAVLSVNAIGAKCGIHASSFVRYAQSLGYKGFKDLQAVFQRRLTTAAPGFHGVGLAAAPVSDDGVKNLGDHD